MESVKEYKCPACDGAIRFVPGSEYLKCEYCGTKTSIKELKAAEEKKEKEEGGEKKESTVIEGFDFLSLKDQAVSESAEGLPVYNCVSCAAEVIAPVEQAALTCPYCGNNIVLTDKLSGPLRPDGIIPFKYTPDALSDAVKKYYRGKKLLPRGFFSESSIGNVTGVYLPFWVFDGKIKGTLIYNGDTVSSSRSGDYVETTTKHYRLTRDVSMDFQNMPVDASSKTDDALMDCLEPFDLSQIKPFDMNYLAGFTADRFDEPKSRISDRARKRMQRSASDVAASRVGSYLNVRHTGGSLHADLKAKYILFPVYLFDVNFNGKKYDFAFNGQTGKVVGKLPIDDSVKNVFFWSRTGIIAGGLILFSVIKYLLGF